MIEPNLKKVDLLYTLNVYSTCNNIVIEKVFCNEKYISNGLLTKTDISNAVNAYIEQHKDKIKPESFNISGNVNKGLLYVKENTLTFKFPKGIYTVPSTKALNLSYEEYNFNKDFIFHIKNGSLFVFGIDSKSNLYKLPLSNQYLDCRYCMGTNDIPLGGDVNNAIKSVTEGFFNSYFNEHLIDNLLKSFNLKSKNDYLKMMEVKTIKYKKTNLKLENLWSVKE